MRAARSLFARSSTPSGDTRPAHGNRAGRASDEALVARIQAGDTAAYRTLVERYTPMIVQLTQRFADTPAAAEDLAQEVFIKAYKALARFEGQARFSSWLYAIALNRCRDYAKNVRRNIYRLAEVRAAAGDPPTPTAVLPDRTLEQREQAQALERAMLQLPEILALPFLLYYNHGLTHGMIATMLDISESASKVRVHRARHALRRLLDPLL